MKAIEVKYIGPSGVRGSRIKAYDSDGNQVTLSYDDGLNHDANARAAAEALCKKMNWSGRLVMGSTNRGEVFVFDDFADPRDAKPEAPTTTVHRL